MCAAGGRTVAYSTISKYPLPVRIMTVGESCCCGGSFSNVAIISLHSNRDICKCAVANMRTMSRMYRSTSTPPACLSSCSETNGRAGRLSASQKGELGSGDWEFDPESVVGSEGCE